MPTEVMPAMILAMTQAKTNFVAENQSNPVSNNPVRTYFPETWIWECLFIDRQNGSFEVRVGNKSCKNKFNPLDTNF